MHEFGVDCVACHLSQNESSKEDKTTTTTKKIPEISDESQSGKRTKFLLNELIWSLREIYDFIFISQYTHFDME